MINFKPRILMFAPLCYPPAGSEAIVTSKLVLAMVQAGWEVDVVSQGDFGLYYPTQEDPVWEPVKRCLISIDGIARRGIFDRLVSLPLFRFLERFRPILWSLKSACVGARLMREKRYDAIFSRVAPQYGHLPALLLSFLFATPWCAAWSDPMPPRKAPAPYGGGIDADIGFAMRSYLRLVVARAGWHVFPCERLRNYVSRYLETGERSSSIPHIAVSQMPVEPSPVGRDRFTVCFAGSLAERNPTTFLKGVKLFLDRHLADDHTEIIFVSNRLDDVRAVVSELGIAASVMLHSEKTYQETMSLMAVSSVLLVIEADSTEGIFFPSKFVDFVQLGRPVLAVSPRNGTLSDILSRHGGGIAVDIVSVEDIARGIAELYLAWKAGTLEQSYGAERLLPLFCDDAVLGSYLKVIGNIRKYESRGEINHGASPRLS